MNGHSNPEERELAAALLLRLSNQRRREEQHQEQQQQAPRRTPPAPTCPIVLIDEEEEDAEATAEKGKLSINFLLNNGPSSTSTSTSTSAATTPKASAPLLPPLHHLQATPSATTSFHYLPSPSSPPSSTLSSRVSTTSTPSAVVPPPSLLYPVGAPLSFLPTRVSAPEEGSGANDASADALRLRREVHLQRQRKLLLDLLQEKEKEIQGKWGVSHDDVDGLVVDTETPRLKNGVLGNHITAGRRRDGGHHRRRAPAMAMIPDMMDGLDGLDAMDGVDGAVEIADGFNGMRADRRMPAVHRSATSSQLFHKAQSYPLSLSGAYSDQRQQQHASNGQHRSWTPEPDHRHTNGHRHANVNNNINESSRRAREQSLSLMDYGGSLDELDGDDEGGSPPELTRLYGGSNHLHQHQQIDDLARRRRRNSARLTPPIVDKPVAQAMPTTREEPSDDEWTQDVGDTAQFRSAMPPLPSRLRRASMESLSSSAGDGANGEALSAAEDSARKRASPAQMQMLQQILSYYEQSPQKIQELERSAVVPIRRRKRRNDASSNSAASSSGSSTHSTSSSSASSPVSQPYADGGEARDASSDDQAASARKRRRRDREVLIFHHMNVQEDGKVMVTQRS